MILALNVKFAASCAATLDRVEALAMKARSSRPERNFSMYGPKIATDIRGFPVYLHYRLTDEGYATVWKGKPYRTFGLTDPERDGKPWRG